MKKICAVCILFFAIGGLVCAQSDESLPLGTEGQDASVSPASTVSSSNVFRQEGVASWYGAEFAGRPTASGEIFDPAQLTAAHIDLPFGTYLIVTNTANGKKIAVRVNDRGPFVRSRILDVSRAAAERLDMLAAGTAKVVIESTTREGAQALVRELGVSAAASAGTTPQPPAASQGAQASAASTPPPAASAASASRPAEIARTVPQRSESGTPASATPATPASAQARPQTAAPAQPVAAAQPRASTAPAQTGASAAGRAAPVVPAAGTAGNAAASTPNVRAAPAVPVMTPTTPRSPVAQPSAQAARPAVAPPTAPTPARVSGEVVNIPGIRRAPEPGYVVVDEQTPPPPPAYTPPAPAAPVPTAAVAPARPAAATTPPSAPRPATATQVPRVPATTGVSTPAASAQVAAAPTASAQPASATPRAGNAVAAPPPAQSQVPPSNPAAAVPVTNPRPAVSETVFTGSSMVPGKNYRIQVGSFTDMKNASEIFLKLLDAGLTPSYERYEDKYYRVVITNVKAEDAGALSQKLASLGITEALAREDVSR